MTSSKGPWHYDVEKQRKLLILLRERYFRNVIAFPDGTLTHHSDCDTHRAFPAIYCCAPCNCGLLHDLCWLVPNIMVKIYPGYWDDELRANGIDKNSEEFKERKKRLKELGKVVKDVCAGFGPPCGPTQEEQRAINKQDWQLIKEVFGEEFAQRQKSKWKIKVMNDGEDKSMSYYQFIGKTPGCAELPDS